uniref:Major facilitator superfamily (MFS) profile domain-containing protein n=1 Tax=Neobodo designis TaxID=312471 RepID=A0A7S1MAH2_NEODS
MNGGDPATMFQSPEFRRTRLLRILAVSWVGYAAYSMGRRPLSVARAVISKDTGLTVAETGAVDTAFLIMYTVGQLAFGPIQRTTGWSARALLAAGLGGSALTLFLFASCSTVTGMSLAWGLNGLLQAVGWASCMIVVSPWLGTSERGFVMGVWGTTMAVGGVLGNTVTPIAIGATHSWRGGTSVIAMIMLGAAALLWLLLGQHPNAHGYLAPAQAAAGVQSMEDLQRGRGNGGAATRTVEGEVVAEEVKGASKSQDAGNSAGGAHSEASKYTATYLLWRVPGVLGICTSYFCAKLVRYVLMFWLPFYFTDALHHGTGMAGLLASALDVGGIVGSIGSGVLSDRYHGGRRRAGFTVLLSAAMVLCLAGFSLGSAFATNPVYALVVGFACGACAYGIDSVMTGSLVQDFAERQGLAPQLGAISGLVGGLGTLGSVLQGPFTVAVSGLSWEVLFGILQLLTVASMAALYRPWRLETAHGSSAASAHHPL